jgi:hypothetical protein
MAITISGDSPNITTLALTTLSDGTNSTSSTNAIQGSAKAWVNFNGTGTVAIRSSYNISSITDNGAGTYTINFTTAMPNANYCMTSSTVYTSGTGDVVICALDSRTAQTAGALPVVTYGSIGSYVDKTYVNVSVFSS